MCLSWQLTLFGLTWRLAINSKVYIRDLKTRKVVKEIDFADIIGTSKYDRAMSGLERKVDWERFYIDSGGPDKEHAKQIEARKKP